MRTFDHTDNDGDSIRATLYRDGDAVIRVRENGDRWRYVGVSAAEVANLIAYLEGE